MEMRTCRYCGEEHPLNTYEEANTIKGKVYRRWRCHKCYMKVKRVRRQKTKKWFNELKKTFACKKCGDNRFYVLDLHHRDPEKKDSSLANTSSWSKERILKEIEKTGELSDKVVKEMKSLIRDYKKEVDYLVKEENKII